ncbi:DUF5522 domain-containing protein [Mucilaginibacter sp.]|uniref:DUF5522 domain-containing protein n=1 Tax=Mucilaginibacter sp. TaxID=1882438 RepID=UPI003B007E4C
MELEKQDFYIDENGNTVFTAYFHVKRGYCCKNKCRHCPWNFGREKQNSSAENKLS